jgi:hypothetical protein
MTDINDKYREMIKSQMKDQINAHYDSLVVTPSLDLTRLPEEVFVNSFLPFFCGERQVTEDPEILRYWVGIAGMPSKEVQIVDKYNKDLFKVPALADSGIIDSLNSNEGEKFSAIIDNYRRFNNITPAAGINYLHSTLGKRTEKLLVNSQTFSDNAERWDQIFIRYGKKTPEKSEEQVNSAKSKVLSDDEFDYE